MKLREWGCTRSANGKQRVSEEVSLSQDQRDNERASNPVSTCTIIIQILTTASQCVVDFQIMSLCLRQFTRCAREKYSGKTLAENVCEKQCWIHGCFSVIIKKGFRRIPIWINVSVLWVFYIQWVSSSRWILSIINSN